MAYTPINIWRSMAQELIHIARLFEAYAEQEEMRAAEEKAKKPETKPPEPANYPKATSNKVAYTMRETMAATGLSRTTIHRHIKEGRLKHRKVGRRVFILIDDLRDFFQAE